MSSQSISYIAKAVPSQGGYVVTFPDFQQTKTLVVTEGDTLEEAKEMAKEALMAGLDLLKTTGEEFPKPEYRLSDAYEEIKQFKVTIELSDFICYVTAHCNAKNYGRSLEILALADDLFKHPNLKTEIENTRQWILSEKEAEKNK